MDNIDSIIQSATILIGSSAIIISFLALVTSLVVEVIKTTGIYGENPIKLITYIVGILVTECALLVMYGLNIFEIQWSYFIIAIFAGLFVGSVAMSGWDNISDIWNKVKNNNENSNG